MPATMEINFTQIRALLWKDVLVRFRQPVLTITQNVWVILIFISLYTVRNKFQPLEVDKCEFPTRQLPSKGELLPFFQSYICTIENECLRPNESFSEISQFVDAPITPLLKVVQTFLNEPALYEAITELPVNLDFLTTIISIATHPSFGTIQEHLNGFIKLLPRVRTVFNGDADLSKLFADDHMFSNTGNILCGKPFPRSDNIRYVDRMIYSQDFNGANPDELDAMPTPYCKQLYLDVTNTNNGKITWTLLKPVIQGKILYGPFSSGNEKIIQNANTTFEEMSKLKLFFGALNETIVKIRTDNDTQADFLSLVELAQSPIVSSVVGNVGVEAVQELLNGLLYDETVLMTVQVIKNILECFSVDRFVSVPTEKDLERKAKDLDDKKLFFAGIYFHDLNNAKKKHFEYELRMITDNTPVTYENKNRFWFPGPDGSFEFDLRYHRGFIQIQHAIDLAIIKTAKLDMLAELGGGDESTQAPSVNDDEDDDDFGVTFDPFELVDKPSDEKPTTQVELNGTTNEETSTHPVDLIEKTTEVPETELQRKKRQMGGFFDMLFGGGDKPKNEPKIESESLQYYTKQFSYPKYMKDDFKTGLYLAQSVQMAFFFALIVHVALATRHRLWMKESCNSMLMRSMGLKPLSEHISWWTIHFIEIVVAFLIALIILYSGGILVTSSIWFIVIFLIVFGICTLTFCYMMSTFFYSASIGSVATVILFLTTFLPYIVVIALGSTLSRSSRFFTHLFFSTAFCNCWRQIIRMELQQREVTFGTLWAESTVDDGFKYGFIMLLVDIALYLAIGMICEKFKQSDLNFYEVSTRETDSQTGAEMINVSKFYNTDKLAVSQVSMVFPRNQISCLLGRNGAGKSTIIKMLTGQLLPSSGELYISRGKENRKTHVGLCSQNNILIPNLTAREHLELYAAIKLNDCRDAEVDKIMNELHLEKYQNYRAHELSGGFKRRLSVAMAFLGSPNLVILDEPCSGVDQRARKNIWELIETLKEGRAVILATHYLDEAEHLSDNILIMNNGKIIMEATPATLKVELTKTFTIRATIIKSFSDLNNEREDEIQSKLYTVAPNANFDIKGSNLIISVKYDERPEQLPKLIKIFEEFEAEGKLCNFRVSSRNLDDIFNALNRVNNPTQATSLYKHYQKNQNGIKNGLNSKYYQNGHNKNLVNTAEASPKEKLLAFVQVVALLMWKRWTHFRRNYRLLITILLLPPIFIIIAMSFMKLRPLDEHGVALTLSKNLYPNSSEFYSYEKSTTFTEDIRNSLWNSNTECIANNSQICVNFDDSESANNWLLNTHNEYIGRRYAGMSFNATRLVVWYNNKGYHSMPRKLNQVNSAIFKSELNDSGYGIGTINHPFKFGDKELSTSSILQQVSDAGISLIILVAFSLVVAANSIHIVSERTSGEKLQQKLCGIKFWTYWGVTYVWNLLLYLIVMVLAIIIFKWYAIPVYVDKGNLAGICLLLFLYGLAMIPAVHVLEKLFSDASIANMTLFCLNIIIGMTTITIIILFDVLGDTERSEKIRDFLNGLFLIFPQHALSDGLILICTNYIKYQVFQIYYIDTYKHPITSDLLRANYEALILQAIFFMVVNFIWETGLVPKLLKSSPGNRSKQSNSNDLQFVTIAKSVTKNDDSLDDNGHGATIAKLSDVSMSYKAAVKALDSISFSVKSGECFGLLGANGAGKSTIFGLLSGQLRPSSGIISLGRDGEKIEISYVPQTNAIDQLLTVDEIIQFYGKLRRVPDIEALTKKTLHAYHLESYRYFLVKDLSGGNRRKLSFAVACFGKTQLILMDEPTSDMDPVTRTLIYRSINELLFEHRTVMLTSHSVSEIENVCDRIAIMKNGRLISIGTPDELKQLCGNSYLVTIFHDKIESLAIERDVRVVFPTAEDTIRHSHSLQFVVAVRDISASSEEETSGGGLALSDIFEKLYKFCGDRHITFNVSQTLMDRAFEQLLVRDDAGSAENDRDQI